MGRFIDLTKRKFGRLVVAEYAGKDRWGTSLWLCLCNCGKEKIIRSHNLLSGNTKSCGCLHDEGNNFKHGHNKRKGESRTYSSWRGMIERCNNPNSAGYKYCGSRGITICKRWSNKKNGFENFLKDMGKRPKGKQLDRIDNDKLKNGYCKNNCLWVLPKINCRNKSNNHKLKHNGEKQCIATMAEKYNIPYSILQRRIRDGWSTKRALLTPIRTNNR